MIKQKLSRLADLIWVMFAVIWFFMFVPEEIKDPCDPDDPDNYDKNVWRDWHDYWW